MTLKLKLGRWSKLQAVAAPIGLYDCYYHYSHPTEQRYEATLIKPRMPAYE